MDALINKSEQLIWRDEEVALKCTFLQEPLLCFFVRASASTRQRGCLHCGGPFSTFERARTSQQGSQKATKGRKEGRPLARRPARPARPLTHCLPDRRMALHGRPNNAIRERLTGEGGREGETAARCRWMIVVHYCPSARV